MKIKSVCELTGLTDRTIRYYIEEKLIFPQYTENYLGRRSYDFSQKNVKDLKDIAVLRKFDFTLDEIKFIIDHGEVGGKIISGVKARTETSISDGQKKLSVLLKISTEKTYTMAELAEELSKEALSLPQCKEATQFDVFKTVVSILKTIVIFMVVWLPIVLSLFCLMGRLKEFHYPVLNPFMIVMTILSLMPSVLVLFIPKIKPKKEKIARRILLLLCVLSIPGSCFLSYGIVSKSETTDFRYYRDFDVECLADRNKVFRELLPNWSRDPQIYTQADGTMQTVFLDAHYYYRYDEDFDSTCDVYAEWPLASDEYAEEVERAEALLGKTETYYRFVEQQKGDWRCLILYDGYEPFDEIPDNYTYIIFAHNDKTQIVRYIYCDSMRDGTDQPYYLKLPW